MEHIGKQVTIYSKSSFGVNKFEGKILEFGQQPYAQYPNATFVKFIPKGKRKPYGFIEGYNPYFVIIEGYNHPNTLDAFKQVSEEVQASKYSCYDERYLTEFDEVLNKYIEENKCTVLLDVRKTCNTNIINN